MMTFYGGKFRATSNRRRYPPPREGNIICEPFAGGAGYSLRYGRNREVVLVEKDELIVEVWEYLLSATPEDILAIPLLEDDQDVRDLPIPKGAQALVARWVNSASATPRYRFSKFAREYRDKIPGSFWTAHKRATIASCLPFMKRWKIIHGTYEDALDHTQPERTTYFVDPPYIGAGAYYKEDAPKEEEDRKKWFEELGSWCLKLPSLGAFVVVCENHGATWLPFGEPFFTKAFPGKRKGKPKGVRNSQEVVWIGGNPFQDSLFDLLGDTPMA